MRACFKSSMLPAIVLALAISAATQAMAAFSTPFALSNGASMGGVVSLAAGPQTLAAWDGGSQFSFAAETGGVWSASSPIANALSSSTCCTALHADGAGNATLVFSAHGIGTFTSDYSAGAWSTVQQLPSTPPYFVNGFDTFVENANGDAAVVGIGSDFRVVRRTANGAWGAPETIPAPALPNTVITIDGAAIGAGGDLVVSFHVIDQDCETAHCHLALYAATETQAGAGWTLSKRLCKWAVGTFIQSQPFIDAQNRAGIAYVAQFGRNLELRTIVQLSPGGAWTLPRTLVTQAAIQLKRTGLVIIGAETDADGNATIVYGSHIPHKTGVELSYIDGSIPTNGWGAPVELIGNAPYGPAPYFIHFASNSVGGIALAWDNPDNAPITVGARAQTGATWAATGPVGSPHCANPQATCTQIMSLSIDDSGVQRILYDDTSASSLFFSQSL
jgi:hypothetical protein